MKYYYFHQFMLKCNWLCLYVTFNVLLLMATLLHVRTEGSSKLNIVSNNNASTSDVMLSTMASTQREYWPRRPTPPEFSTQDTYQCDYYAAYCLRAYNTSVLCGRTVYWIYQDFTNYCMLDYVNCMERYEMWQVAYMGHCFYVRPLPYRTYTRYAIHDDSFFDQVYIEDEWNLEHLFENE